MEVRHEQVWLRDSARIVVDRVLTAACRDPLSAHYGCFDRNWWHYRIVDFPSLILQQAVETVASAGKAGVLPIQDSYEELIYAGIRFWAKRASMRGSFEEYYPNERSFPAAAFSTLAVTNLIVQGLDIDSRTEIALSVAASRLLDRTEDDAANQELAAIAALARLSQIDERLAPMSEVARRLDAVVSKQSAEGWFPEYYGADTGYLSVSLDCLWEISDACPDLNRDDAKRRAFEYLAQMVLSGNPSLATVNSRNTEYVVPYGIVRMSSVQDTRSMAFEVLEKLGDSNLVSPRKIGRVDDRYNCHYIGRSIAKSWEYLSSRPADSRGGAHEPVCLSHSSMPEAGVFHLTADTGDVNVWVAGKKGGSTVVKFAAPMVAVDHGWRVIDGSRVLVSDWCAPGWALKDLSQSGLLVTGSLVPTTEVTSTPLRHLFLRIAALVLGRRLIPFLKRRLILKSNDSGPRFSRRISATPEAVTVMDNITNLSQDMVVRPAFKASMRHVASADSYSDTDLASAQGVVVVEKTDRSSSVFTSVRRYCLEQVGDAREQ